jgi:predicted nucleotidyltransferase
MPDRVFPDQTALASLCRRHGIRRLSLFGSVLKGTSGPDSDVDLLVEFMPGSEPGLLRLAGIEAEFSALLNGRRVDLRTAPDLSAHFRDDVLRTASVEFAA